MVGVCKVYKYNSCGGGVLMLDFKGKKCNARYYLGQWQFNELWDGEELCEYTVKGM